MLGPTNGYGKKNDHIFHHASLHHIVDHYEKHLSETKGIRLERVNLFTDNCSGQYKSQYNFAETASFSERHPGVTLDHNYAVVYEFKGPHDGYGKVLKNYLSRAELLGIRCGNAYLAWGHLVQKLKAVVSNSKYDWTALEAAEDPILITHRHTFTMTEAHIGYVTDNREEYDKILQEHDGGDEKHHIIFTDRTKPAKTCGAIKGSSRLHRVCSTQKSVQRRGRVGWVLMTSTQSCYCQVCCSQEGTNAAAAAPECPYKDQRASKQSPLFLQADHAPRRKQIKLIHGWKSYYIMSVELPLRSVEHPLSRLATNRKSAIHESIDPGSRQRRKKGFPNRTSMSRATFTNSRAQHARSTWVGA
jgi:hypothetical protein